MRQRHIELTTRLWQSGRAVSARGSWALLIVLLASSVALGQPAFVSLDEHAGPEPESSARSLPFVVRPSQTKLYLDLSATLTAGEITVRVLDPNGAVLREDHTAGSMTVQATLPAPTPGTYQVEVVTAGAVGKWKAEVCPLLPRSAFLLNLISGPAMIVVALGSVGYWWWRARPQWRWFGVGAAVWTVGVAFKFGVALSGNAPILHALKQHLPATAYLIAGAVYIGLLTGIFEIGVTLAAGLHWRRMAADAQRAVAVGVGAGAFEALLLGLGSWRCC